jgi:hypothetical protein
MPPSEQNIAFFTANRSEIDRLLRGINKPRQVEGFKPLSEEETDEIITALVAHCVAGGAIGDFQPELPEPERVPVQLPKKQSDPNAIICTFTPCQNGYVAKIKDKSYIFKSEKELMRIFKELFFKVEVSPSNANKLKAVQASL